MLIKTILPLAIGGAIATAMMIPAAGQAKSSSEFAKRSWIRALNTELKADIKYEAIENNPIVIALFGVADVACLNQAAALELAKTLIPAAQARYAVQRFDERYCIVKHQTS